MKTYFFLLLFAVILFMPHELVADGDERVALSMAEQSLSLNDTMTVRTILNRIASQCQNSDSWEDRFKFYSLSGKLNMLDTTSYSKAFGDLFNAYETYPDTVAPTQIYLSVVRDLCQVMYDRKLFLKTRWGERIAEKALMRCMSIVNECEVSAELFSLLAGFYELRGDTIMPQHFHRKSQELSVKYYYKTVVPADSLELYYKRLASLMKRIDESKSFFNRNTPEYLVWLEELNNQVFSSGNSKETIYLSEYILQTARDSMLLDRPDIMFMAFVNLLYAYAENNELEGALAMLSEAEAYYARYPNEHITKYVMYYYIGLGLYYGKMIQTEKVVYYLQLAQEGLSKEFHSDYLSLSNQILESCKVE